MPQLQAKNITAATALLDYIKAYFPGVDLDTIAIGRVSPKAVKERENIPNMVTSAKDFLYHIAHGEVRLDKSYWLLNGPLRENPDQTLEDKRRFRARRKNMLGVNIIILDDINTKVDEFNVPEAIWEVAGRVESSEGNFQMPIAVDLTVDQGLLVSKWITDLATPIGDGGALKVPQWTRIPFGINGKFREDGTRNEFPVTLHDLPVQVVTFEELRQLFAPGWTDLDIKQALVRAAVSREGGEFGAIHQPDRVLQSLMDHNMLTGEVNDGWHKFSGCTHGHQHSGGANVAGYNPKERRAHCFHEHSEVPEGEEQATDALILAALKKLGPADLSKYPLEEALKDMPLPRAANRLRAECVAMVLVGGDKPASAVEAYKGLLVDAGIDKAAALMVDAEEDLLAQILRTAPGPENNIPYQKLVRCVERNGPLRKRDDSKRLKKRADKAAERKAEVEADNILRIAKNAAFNKQREAEIDGENDARVAAYEKSEKQRKAETARKNIGRIPSRVLKFKARKMPRKLQFTPLVAPPLRDPSELGGRNLGDVEYSEPQVYLQLALVDWLILGVPYTEAVKALKMQGLWCKEFERNMKPLYRARAKRGMFKLSGAIQQKALTAADYSKDYGPDFAPGALAIKAQPGFGKTEHMIDHAKQNGLRIGYITPLIELAKSGAIRLEIADYSEDTPAGDRGLAVVAASLHKKEHREALLACDIICFDEVCAIAELVTSHNLQNAKTDNLHRSLEWIQKLLRRQLTTTNSNGRQLHVFLDADYDDFIAAFVRDLCGKGVAAIEVPENWGERELHGKVIPQTTLIVGDWASWRQYAIEVEGDSFALLDDVKLVTRFGTDGGYSTVERPPVGFGTKYCTDLSAKHEREGRPPVRLASTSVLGRGIDLHTRFAVNVGFYGRLAADGALQLAMREREAPGGIINVHFSLRSDSKTHFHLDRHLEVFNKEYPGRADEYTELCMGVAERADWLRRFGAAGMVDRLLAAGGNVVVNVRSLPQCRGIERREVETEEEAKREGVRIMAAHMAQHTPEAILDGPGIQNFQQYLQDMGILAFHAQNLPPSKLHKALNLPTTYTNGKEIKSGAAFDEWMLWWVINHQALHTAMTVWKPEVGSAAQGLTLITKTHTDRSEIARMRKELLDHLIGKKSPRDLLKGIPLKEGALAFLDDKKAPLLEAVRMLADRTGGANLATHKKLNKVLTGMGLRIVKGVLKESRAGVWNILAMRDDMIAEAAALYAEQNSVLHGIFYGNKKLWGAEYRLSVIAEARSAGQDGININALGLNKDKRRDLRRRLAKYPGFPRHFTMTAERILWAQSQFFQHPAQCADF